MLASRAQFEQIESSVSADKLFELADALKPNVEEKQEKETEFKSVEETKPEIIEIETEEQVEDKTSEYLELISQQLSKAPVHIAVKNIKVFEEEGYPKEFFEKALYVEQESKNRATVIKELNEVLEQGLK